MKDVDHEAWEAVIKIQVRSISDKLTVYLIILPLFSTPGVVERILYQEEAARSVSLVSSGCY